MRAVNLLVGCAVVAFFGQVLALVGYIGKIGYEQGWWGDGLAPVAVAALLAVGATATCVTALFRWFG